MNMDRTEIMKDTIQESLMNMLNTIAYNNYDFICSTCLELKDQIIELAGKVLGSDMAEILSNAYELTIKELQGEDE